MIAKSFWLVLIGSLTFAAAEEQKEVPAEKEKISLEKSLQPRALGAVWVHRSVYYDAGEMYSVGTAYEKVLKQVEIEGVACYEIEYGWDYRTKVQRLMGSGGEDEKGTMTYWEYVDATGSYYFEVDQEEPKAPKALTDFIMTLKFPAQKGMRYETDESSWEVLETEKKVKLSSGEFTCVVYQSMTVDPEDPEFINRERLYMAPGVGMVKWESEIKNEDGGWDIDSREGMLSYSLKNKEEKLEKKE